MFYNIKILSLQRFKTSMATLFQTNQQRKQIKIAAAT